MGAPKKIPSEKKVPVYISVTADEVGKLGVLKIRELSKKVVKTAAKKIK